VHSSAVAGTTTQLVGFRKNQETLYHSSNQIRKMPRQTSNGNFPRSPSPRLICRVSASKTVECEAYPGRCRRVRLRRRRRRRRQGERHESPCLSGLSDSRMPCKIATSVRACTHPLPASRVDGAGAVQSCSIPFWMRQQRPGFRPARFAMAINGRHCTPPSKLVGNGALMRCAERDVR
jgi:hypothetical protein